MKVILSQTAEDYFWSRESSHQQVIEICAMRRVETKRHFLRLKSNPVRLQENVKINGVAWALIEGQEERRQTVKDRTCDDRA
jgi:hypothetical protein